MRGRHAEDDVVGVYGVADFESEPHGPIGVAREGHVTYFLVLFEVSSVASSSLVRLRWALADYVPYDAAPALPLDCFAARLRGLRTLCFFSKDT